VERRFVAPELWAREEDWDRCMEKCAERCKALRRWGPEGYDHCINRCLERCLRGEL